MRLATRMTPVFGSCDYSFCASQPCQDSLNWHSLYGDEAVVRRKMTTTWVLPNPGTAKNMNMLMMFGNAHGWYLMASMSPLS